MQLPVVFLMGATACGKTDLSLSLARKLDAEIISVDSALVYRGLDIGTAKPSAAELARIPHHLIDICEPWEAYSAARFCSDARQLITDIQSRGKRVLLVGGTMLYFKALEEGLATLPDADKAIRAELVTQAERIGWPAMHAHLQLIDPLAASRIHPNDPQRLQRALEVHRITGIPLSQLQADTHSVLDKPPVKFALVPEHRAWLHQRIELRFQQMVEYGFLAEVNRLRQLADVHAQLPAMRSVGYRQAWQYLDERDARAPVPLGSNTRTTADDPAHKGGMDDELLPAGKAEWIDKAQAATRQLAKRQLTWLRSMSGVTCIACDTLSMSEQEAVILDALDALSSGVQG